jgi:hypothetical protein
MTCNSEHNYRAPKSAEVPARAKSARALTPKAALGGPKKPTSRVAAREEWEAAVRSGRPFRVYAATHRFQPGELVQHTKFGDGFVRDVAGTDKIIVAFSDGDRTLIHGLSA